MQPGSFRLSLPRESEPRDGAYAVELKPEGGMRQGGRMYAFLPFLLFYEFFHLILML